MVTVWQHRLLVAAVLATDALLSAAAILTMQLMVDYWQHTLGQPYGIAATTYGCFGTLESVFGMSAAPAFDELPALPLIFTGMSTAAALRAALAWPGVSLGVATLVVMLMAGADALVHAPLDLLTQRLLDAAPSRHTADHQTYVARVYGLAYALGNGAAALASVTYDALQQSQRNEASANMGMLWLLVLVHGVAALPILLLLPRLVPYQTQRQPRLLPPSLVPLDPEKRARLERRRRCATLRFYWNDRNLWRFTGVCVLLLGVRMVFRHLDTTLPAVLARVSEDGGHSRFALVQAVNPFLIMFLAFFMQLVLAPYDHYKVIATGTTVSTLALLPVVLGGGTFWPSVVFVALFSLGESIWSARIRTYAMHVAPKNRRATYFALAGIPGVVARIPTSMLSTALVNTYCPTTDLTLPCDARTLWLMIMLISAVTPLGLWLGKRWLRAPSAQDDPDVTLHLYLPPTDRVTSYQ